MFREQVLSQLFLFALLGSAATQAQEHGEHSEFSDLPLPAHPERYEEEPEHTEPRESQPQRSSRHSESQSQRSASTRIPVPGKPSRNLPPIGESASEDADESPAPSGILDVVPHSYHNGAINVEFIYTGETFTKAHGGINRSSRTNYRSNLDIVATMDTELMDWWSGGRFLVYGQNLAGQPLSTSHVGDVQLFSNLDSTISETERPHFTTIAEYWYEHLLFDDLIRWKIGKQDSNADFAYSDLGGDFIHSSFGVSPNIPLPTFPSQALGSAVFLSLTETMVFGFGAYDGSLPDGPQGVRWGFDTLGDHGAMTLYQLEYKPQFGPNEQLPHTTRIGLWNHSDKTVWTDFRTPGVEQTYSHNYGFFWNTDQFLWKEEYGTDNDQGLGIFTMYGWAPSDRNVLNDYYGIGLTYKGLIPGRDDDILGIATANVLFSDHYRNYASVNDGETIGSYENAIEVFYKMLATPFVTLQPDLQYISNPGGQHKDALLVGLRFEAVL